MSGGHAMEFEHFKQATLQHFEGRKHLVQSNNVAILKGEGERQRRKFLEMACLEPPSQVRLINCQATCEENQVVLIDWCADHQVEYAAISHTFGMEVYEVFDCVCTTKCFTKQPRACSGKTCPGHDADNDPRNRVVSDILNMCAILRSAGVEYAWHDGVCIAQHDKVELEDTIKHIGWIYSYARETIIFLHYVGTPMGPIRPDGDFQSRWQTRVWTLQEAALSKRRRYCVRVGITSQGTLSGCKSLQELEDKIAYWYRKDSSKVTIIEEEAYWQILIEIYNLIIPLCADYRSSATDDPTLTIKAWTWCACITDWVLTLIQTCFQFPTIAVALEFCSARDSKHVGDRINSILALAGVKDFIAHKDDNMEGYTIEFFKRQGQQGLARAVFTSNNGALKADIVNEYGRRRHTWIPILSSPLKTVYEAVKESSSDDIEGQVNTSFVENFIKFTVLEDGKLELRGEMACIAIKFTYNMSGIMPEEIESTPQGGPLVVIHENMAGTNSESASTSIAMDLTFDMDGFKSALAQASSLALGTAVVPMIINDIDHGKKPIHLPSPCCMAACRWASKILGNVGRAAFSCCGLHAGAESDHHKLQQHAAQEALSLVSNGALARACSTMEPGWMSVISSISSASSPSPQLTQVPALNLGLAIFPILSSGGLGPLVKGREIQDKESFWAHMVLPLPPLLQHHAFTSSHPPSHIPFWDWRVPALLVRGDLNAQVSKVGCFHLKKELKDILTVLLPTLSKIHKLVII